MIAVDESQPIRERGPAAETLAGRLGETTHRSVLRRRAAGLGLRDGWDLLALAVRRGCRHYSGVGLARDVADPGLTALPNEELVVLLLAGGNAFEPFLIRAAAELLRAVPIDLSRLAGRARRERCERVLAYLARAGVERDSEGTEFWRALLAQLSPQRTVPPGVLPHWSRFVALHGVGRDGRNLGSRWIGAVP